MSREVEKSGSQGDRQAPSQYSLPYGWVGWWPVRVIRRCRFAGATGPSSASGCVASPLRARTHPARPGDLRGDAHEYGGHAAHSLGTRQAGDRIVVTAARDFFFRRSRPGFGPFVALAFGAVPIDRTVRHADHLTTRLRGYVLDFSLVIYPQGTIPGPWEDERRLRRGVALLDERGGLPGRSGAYYRRSGIIARRCPLAPTRIGVHYFPSANFACECGKYPGVRQPINALSFPRNNVITAL